MSHTSFFPQAGNLFRLWQTPPTGSTATPVENSAVETTRETSRGEAVAAPPSSQTDRAYRSAALRSGTDTAGLKQWRHAFEDRLAKAGYIGNVDDIPDDAWGTFTPHRDFTRHVGEHYPQLVSGERAPTTPKISAAELTKRLPEIQDYYYDTASIGQVKAAIHDPHGAEQDTVIRYRGYFPEGEVKNVVLIQPGFTEPMEKYMEMLYERREDRAAGTAFVIAPLAGMGENEPLLADQPRMGFIYSTDDYVAGIDAVNQAVQKHLEGKLSDDAKTTVIGHSAGGETALEWLLAKKAAGEAPPADRFLLSAPAAGVRVLTGSANWMARGAKTMLANVLNAMDLWGPSPSPGQARTWSPLAMGTLKTPNSIADSAERLDVMYNQRGQNNPFNRAGATNAWVAAMLNSNQRVNWNAKAFADMPTEIFMVAQPGDQLVNYAELVSIAKKSGGTEQLVDDTRYVTGGGLTLLTNKAPEGAFPEQHESSTTMGSDEGLAMFRTLLDDTLRGVERKPTEYRWGMKD